jgi:hypothetical protein
MDRCRTAEEQATRWRAAGIPPGYTISQLLYNSASGFLIVEVCGMRDHKLPSRLLARHKSADTYEPLGCPEEGISFESPVTSENLPILVFNSMRLRRNPDGSERYKDWNGLYALNLQTMDLTLCVHPNNLPVPAPYDDRGWIAQVFGLSDDECWAYVKVGLGRHQDESEIKNIYFDYHLAQVSLKDGELKLISRLDNIHF